ncbi:hypothetical protein OG225_43435 (plasmid) [Nocardia sp. NBC_01377]|uniref:hypothetical protein n=1 Tax=Nocardia sp. NBC_01377 TaxID=2903595 RepID=UPI002F9101F9
MQRKNRLMMGLGGMVASAMIAVTVGAGTATAAPTGCSKGGGNTYANAICTGGNGSYQAYATCFNPTIPGATFYKFVEGPWKRAGSKETSTVWCPFLYVVESRGIGLRK